MTVAWVIGGGGLIGAALCRALRRSGTKLFFPAARLCWGYPGFDSQLVAAVQAFASQVEVEDRWEIYWAAGVGTMSSAEDILTPETKALALVLRLLAADPRLRAAVGAIVFTSSAGAVYAGSRDTIITENTAEAPTTAYAREKLKHEGLINDFALSRRQTTALIARVSTVYGPGQAAGKQQGLLTHIARRILRNQPIQIYVPYDTIRDYITADDAAGAMVRVLRLTRGKSRVLVKIIASEHPATICEIISVFKRVTRRKPRVVISASRLSSLYSRRVQFRSMVFPDFPRPPVVSLPVGIAQLMAAERANFVRSSVR